MNEQQYYCIADKDGFYRDLCLASTSTDKETGETSILPENYTLAEGEFLVLRTPDCPQPTDLLRPKWDGERWTEDATAEELLEWEQAHPAQTQDLSPIARLQLAVAELAEVQAEQDLENKLALAELAETL